jgi:hypothetical protein
MSNGNGPGAFWNRLSGRGAANDEAGTPSADEEANEHVGEDQHPSDELGAPAALIAVEPAPEQVAVLVEQCLARVKAETGVELDFTAETLPLVDHVATTARERLAADPSAAEGVAQMLGAYLGEVARRRAPMRWFAPPGEHRRWRLELSRVLLTWNPIGAALESLLLTDAPGWGGNFRIHGDDRELAESALSVLPDVSIEDYYAPSHRLEICEIVADAIFHYARKAGEGKTFEASDYGPLRAEAIADALDDDD